jgi:hypothetical protein
MSTFIYAGEAVLHNGAVVAVANRDIEGGEPTRADAFDWVGAQPQVGEDIRGGFRSGFGGGMTARFVSGWR